MSTTTTGPLLLAHDDEGTGPAVVLIHSGITDRGMWAPVLPALAASHRVVAPDLRGFGESPQPGEDYADADDVAHLLDALGIDRAAVVGSSYGGRIALELAARHPERVASLVLLNAAFRGLEVTDPDVLAFGEREDELLEAGDVAGATALNVDFWLLPEVPEAVRADVARMQRRAFEVQLAADEQDPPPRAERVEVDPATITVPTLVVSGDRDVAHHRDIARLLAREIPGADLLELDWAGHLPSVERPDETAALILDRLDRLDRLGR